MSPRRPLTLVTLLVFALVSAMPIAGAAAQRSGMSVTVELQEYDNSGITGRAVLTETTTGGTHVSMVLVGAELDGNHPTHIHTGTCDNFDPNPLYPLETVNLSPVSKDGLSETTVGDVDLATLHGGEYVILVHQSPDQLTNYLICGEIGGGSVGTAALVVPGSTPSAHHVPVTGAGFTGGTDRSGSSVIVLLSVLAFASALSAGAVRRTRM